MIGEESENVTPETPKTWFEIENRVRNIITQLIQPIASQLGEALEKVDGVVRQNGQFMLEFEKYDQKMEKTQK